MKYSEEIKNKICGELSRGVKREDAIILCDVSRATFYDWKKNKPDFLDAIKKAETNNKAILIETVQEAAKKQWQAAAWTLERKYPDEFGQRIKQEHTINPVEKIKRKLEIDEFKDEDNQSEGGVPPQLSGG